MLLATLICSDPDCEEELEIEVRRLAQLGDFLCECGHGFVLATVSELKEAGGEVVSIATRLPSAGDQRSRNAA